MIHTTTLFILLSAFTLAACGGAPDTAPANDTGPQPTMKVRRPRCDVIDSSATEQIFAFSDPNTAAPVGTECISLGGGYFTCTPDACVATTEYAGTCPHCPGGGE